MLAVINDTGILVVLVAVVLLFGASRIPKLARNLGEASKEFRDAQDHPEAAPPREMRSVGAGPEKVTMTRDELEALLRVAGSEAGPAARSQAG